MAYSFLHPLHERDRAGSTGDIQVVDLSVDPWLTGGADVRLGVSSGGVTTSPRDALLEQAIDWFAANGVGDTSLRALAAGIGTSHRMVIYHFGSREGLLTAVVESIRRRQQQELQVLLDTTSEPLDAAWTFWTRVADDSATFAPLFFELSAAAMQGHDWAEQVRDWVTGWTQTMSDFFLRLGNPPEHAALLGRTAMAITRGTLLELALTGDRRAADETIAAFLRSTESAP